MNDKLFRTLLSLWMCSDPWPLTLEEQDVLEFALNEESVKRGYKDMIGAYHYMPEFVDKPIMGPVV